jgi:hypothetical protein
MEVEQNQSLPFLGVLVSRRPNGSLGHKVYRKPTHTNFYLHMKSDHHPTQKKAVLTMLIQCAWTICDADSLDAEIEHLKNTFRQNEYSNYVIKQVIYHKKATNTTGKADWCSPAALPESHLTQEQQASLYIQH